MRETRHQTTAERSRSRAVLGSAIAAIAVLVLLMPATPLVGFLLMAAIVLGVVAAFVARAEVRRGDGATVERLSTRGYLVLEDRVSPGLTGTIGRLVIGPGGVFVIETRDYPGRVRVRGDRLVVGHRSHDVASHLRSQVAAVASTLEPVLDGTGASVVPLICVRHAELPLIGRSVAGIPLLRESQLERRIAGTPQVLDARTIERLGDLVQRTMPAQPRRRLATPTVDLTLDLDTESGLTELSAFAPEPVAMSSGMTLPGNLALPSGGA